MPESPLRAWWTSTSAGYSNCGSKIRFVTVCRNIACVEVYYPNYTTGKLNLPTYMQTCKHPSKTSRRKFSPHPVRYTHTGPSTES
ncbi:hypothetical protein Mapa_003323 [Marchantia paleacea]|nr:hypothetical protein Mapa_003323 [Marchantia paleacea]